MQESNDPRGSGEEVPSAQDLREDAGSQFMGPGFIRQLTDAPAKRRAYEFWYHPYTELAIFTIIIVSVSMLLIEVASPTDRPVGWMGGVAGGTITGWFFWVDAAITLFFVIEYASKLWIAPAGRKWFFIRHSWIELLALLPVLRVFRLFRILRAAQIFRLLRVLRSVRLARTGTFLNRIFTGFGAELERNRAGNLIVLIYFLSAMVFGTTGVMIFEKGADSGFDSLGHALWWCVVTISTVGYGDIVPVTPGGRIVASAVVLAGLGFWSLVTGVFASALINRSRRRETMGLDILGIHGHVVIYGWNENGRRLVRDLRPSYPDRHVVVVTEDDYLGLPLDARLHLLNEDPTRESAIRHSQIDQARSAVVLADDSSCNSDVDIDARTILICMAIRRLNSDVRIVAELRDTANYGHARRAGASDAIVTHNYTGALLSQSIQSPGVNRAFADLFDIGRGSVFTEIAFPDNTFGLPHSQAAAHLYKTRRVAVIGLRRDDRLRIDLGDDPEIEPGDIAVVILPLESVDHR